MKYPKIVCLAIGLFSISALSLNAQEQLGLKLENYSGINSVLFNPTYQVTSPFKWDVNLVAAGYFFDNNYAYLQDASVFDVMNNGENIRPRPDINPETENPDDYLLLDFYDSNKKKQGSVLTTVMGPSVMINLNSGLSLGVFTNFRATASARKIPTSLNYYTVENQAFFDEFKVDPFKVAGMSWSELGINVAKQIETTTGTIAIGGNVKFLNGYEAFYLNNKTSFDMSKLRGDSLAFQTLNVDYAFTNSNIDNDNFDLERNGGGLGFDLGFSYIRTVSNGGYHWKVGAALIDVGRIKFNQNAQRHSITPESAFELALDEYDDAATFEDGVDLLSFQSLSDSIASLDGNTFNVWLPAALTAYGDYRISQNVYVNAALVQSIPLGENAVARDNILALTPRYERRWFGAMLPVSMYNYSKLRVGASVRLAFLTIGSENLGSFFKQNEFTGSDFYVAVKINPFDVGRFGKGKGGKHVKCYNF